MAMFAFASFTNTNHVDWSGTSDSGMPYVSYMRASYLIADDPAHHFGTPYIYFYLRNQIPNDAGPEDPSQSCLFQGVWNWTNGDGASKFSRQEEIYQFRQNHDITVTRKKVRGNGKVLQMRFTSGVTDEDNHSLGFSVYGWYIDIGKNSGP